MKVILLKDVKGIGKKGETVTVKDGYGTNFLLPRGLAVILSDKSLEILNKQNEDAAMLKARMIEEAKAKAKKLESIVVEFNANAGEDGKMFGTISYKQIEEELKKQFDIEIDKRKFIDKTPVDRLGYTKLRIELFKGVEGVVTVHVSQKKQVNMAKIKELPHNTEAEKAVLGAMLTSRACLSEALARLVADDFYNGNENHRVIFSAMLRLYDRSIPVDAQTVTDELLNAKELDVSGGPEYLLELAESIIAYSNINHYINIVKDQATLRRFLLALKDIQENYYEKDIGDVNEFLQRAEDKISRITETRRVGDFQTAREVSSRVSKTIETLKPSATDDMVTGIPTGFKQLNITTHGFHEGEFIVVAARTGVGKTAFSLNLAYNAAVKGNLPVAYFSLEMPSEQLFKRLLSSDSGVEHNSIITGFKLGEREKLALQQSCTFLGGTKMYFEETSGIQILDLMAKARKLKAKEPDLALIVVDHIGLVGTNLKNKSSDRQAEVQYVSKALKKLALELKIAIIAVTQLNRKAEDRPNGEPMLTDLRESGSIEQDADVVLLMWRTNPNAGRTRNNSNNKQDFEKASVEETIAKKEDLATEIININVAKNRHGQMRTFQLLFRKNILKYENPTPAVESQLAELEQASRFSDDD